ncbi:cytochrome c oxidase assembly protein [Pavlovales sp. CCMP2436]|nr:cytochrome c oxidase assembly protein [Pavlovales sp. CCMP2436]
MFGRGTTTASAEPKAEPTVTAPAKKGPPVGADGKPKKICCACPDTKKVRDECMVLKGGEAACLDMIEAHKVCLRSEGFDV